MKRMIACLALLSLIVASFSGCYVYTREPLPPPAIVIMPDAGPVPPPPPPTPPPPPPSGAVGPTRGY